MKNFGRKAPFWAATLATLWMAACGGGGSNSGGGGGGQQQPTIASFTAGAPAIENGSNTTLTGTFSNGTGVITAPGGYSQTVTSGTAVTVSPTATTTYTLTVTGAGGTTPATQNTTVTVHPVPTISSFTPGASTIEATTSTTLTASFAGGTGTISPGNLQVTSGTAVTVSPAATTTYTLTVTPPVGTINATQTATITVVPVPVISSFGATSNTVTSGGSIQFTAVFANGAGVITPGNVVVNSGQQVIVTAPTTTSQITQAYTLTVSPPVGTIDATQTVNITVNPGGASISSFNANPTQIESGSSTHLTPVFSGGTGQITGPGGFSASATTGVTVAVTPPATTTQAIDTYTLTVTPTGGGTTVNKTVDVTVFPQPAITSFTAAIGANPLVAGNSTTLTAVFSGGTGVISPGNISVSSGTAVTVNPTQTTIFMLTVTPPVGTVNATQQLTLTVYPSVSVCTNPSCSGPTISNQLLGMNLAMWYDDITNASAILSAFKTAGITAVRWPGGSNSDVYHWAANNGCNGLYAVPSDTFANFESDIVQAGSLDLAVTANYGSNAACTGGGDPAEAAAWAAASVTDGTPIHYMTVGNENYGSWEYDLHPVKHDPTTYAAAVSGTSGYYSLIKAQSPTTLVGVVVDANCTTANGCTNGWDSTVLTNANNYYDFVEYHYYPQNQGGESDTFLVQQAAQGFTNNIKTLKSELTAAGKPNTPIYVGEVGSVSSNPGKQSWSITQGLYAGQILGEAMNDGVARLTWWIGFGNCNGNQGSLSSSLYGWQGFGAYNIFADGAGDTAYPNNSPCNYGAPIGIMSPTAEAFNLFQNVAVSGQFPQATSVVDGTGLTRAYAATHGSGYALVLFNLNKTTAETVSVTVAGQSSSAGGVTVTTYDKAIYDQSDPTCAADVSLGCSYNSSLTYPAWPGPTTTTMNGPVTLPMTLTLQPWSMNVVIVKP